MAVIVKKGFWVLSSPFISTLFRIMNGTDMANVLPCGMGNAGFWRYGNYFPTAMSSSFPHGRAPGIALTAG